MDIKDEDHDAGLAVEVDSLVKRYGSWSRWTACP